MSEKYYSISPYAYCAGDPVNCIDPDGRWVQCAIGAAIGGVISGAFELYDQVSEKGWDEVSWGKVAMETGKGALQGAIVTSGVGLIGEMAINAVGDAAIETVGQVVEVAVGSEKSINTSEIGHAFVAGAISSGITKCISSKVSNKIIDKVVTKDFIKNSKQEAKQKLKAKGVRVSTANDPPVKKEAKDAVRATKNKIENRTSSVTAGVVQSGTTSAHRKYDKKE